MTKQDNLAVVEAPAGNLLGVPAAQVVQAATDLATPLAEVIKKRELFTVIGKGKQAKKYVHLEGWQTLGSMVGVTAIVTDTEPILGPPNDSGQQPIIGYWSRAEARTMDGRVVGAAESVCTKSESRGPWKNADPYAVLGMAQTRSMSRALKGPLGFIMKLAGYDPTPAEEMEVGAVLDGDADVSPEWGEDPEMAQDLANAARAARALDPVAWSNAKIRAHLAGATEQQRRALLASLNKWIGEHSEGGLEL